MEYRRLQVEAPRPVERPTILVVDDHDELRNAVAVLLEAEGYDVADAANGRDALKYLASAVPHVAAIVLDLAMPVMDGWQFLAMRRKHVSLSRIPTIVVTGISDEKRRQGEIGDLT